MAISIEAVIEFKHPLFQLEQNTKQRPLLNLLSMLIILTTGANCYIREYGIDGYSSDSNTKVYEDGSENF